MDPKTGAFDRTGAKMAASLSQLASLFECPVCRDYALPPIMQCHNGHHLCAACRKKVHTCPICRAPKGEPCTSNPTVIRPPQSLESSRYLTGLAGQSYHSVILRALILVVYLELFLAAQIFVPPVLSHPRHWNETAFLEAQPPLKTINFFETEL